MNEEQCYLRYGGQGNAFCGDTGLETRMKGEGISGGPLGDDSPGRGSWGWKRGWRTCVHAWRTEAQCNQCAWNSVSEEERLNFTF